MAFCEFVLLAACYAFVATVGGLEGPSGGNSFQLFDAMLAALLSSGIELVGRFARFSGNVLEGHFKSPGLLVSGVCSWKRPAGQFCKGTLKDEESTALHVSLVSPKVYFKVSSFGTLVLPLLAPVLRKFWKERDQPIINCNDVRNAVVAETVLVAKAAAAFEGASSRVQSGTWEARQKFQPVQKKVQFFNGKVGMSTSVVRGVWKRFCRMGMLWCMGRLGI